MSVFTPFLPRWGSGGLNARAFDIGIAISLSSAFHLSRMFGRTLCLLLVGWLLCPAAALAGSAKVVKVLSHLVDAQGRHSLSPSHFDRDAYQAYLRSNREKVSGLRYDIQWRSRFLPQRELELKLEIRGQNLPIDTTLSLARKVEPRRLDFLTNWSQIVLTREEFDQAGDVIAWRVTLWDGTVMLAEEKSFLW